jgi:predicted dehydrogenase
MKRRNFVKNASLGLAAGSALFSAASYSRILGSNDRVGIALVGAGRRGTGVANNMCKTGRAELRAICDLLGDRRQRAAEILNGGKVFETANIEDIAARSDIDAVIVATPDHLHRQHATAILNTKKHLYLEKPISVNYEDGMAISKAVEAAGVVCQIGTQQRSGSLFQRAKEEYFGDSDKLGDIAFVRSAWSDFAWQRRSPKPRPKPAELDWEKFIGPSKNVPYDWARFDAWRHYQEYAGGIIADLLNHWVDLAQWMMDDAEPLDAVSLGGVFHLHDGRTNPDTANSIIRYKDWQFSFESTVMPISRDRDSVLFLGTKGRLELFRAGLIYVDEKGARTEIANEASLDLEHTENFLDAIANNSQPSASIEVGLQGVKPAHLAVAAYRSGRKMKVDEASDKIAAVV